MLIVMDHRANEIKTGTANVHHVFMVKRKRDNTEEKENADLRRVFGGGRLDYKWSGRSSGQVETEATRRHGMGMITLGQVYRGARPYTGGALPRWEQSMILPYQREADAMHRN